FTYEGAVWRVKEAKRYVKLCEERPIKRYVICSYCTGKIAFQHNVLSHNRLVPGSSPGWPTKQEKSEPFSCRRRVRIFWFLCFSGFSSVSGCGRRSRPGPAFAAGACPGRSGRPATAGPALPGRSISASG